MRSNPETGSPRALPPAKRRAVRLLLAGVAVAIVSVVGSAPAEAATNILGVKMMCYGADRLYISAPEINEDLYRDLAVPEVLRLTPRGWETYRWGASVYNDDVPVPGGAGSIGGSHTYPGLEWRYSTTHQGFGNWDFFIPTGTQVAVRMWLYDGHTRQWKSQWATNIGAIGGLGGYATTCQAGQYQGYGWWW